MNNHTCQWIGPDQDPRKVLIVTYCGKKSLEGKSYCHDHYWKVFRKGSSVNGRRREREIDREIANLKRIEEENE